MSFKDSMLRRGDVVEVRSAAEIMLTLDADGMLDGLPFMPEMLRFCGKQFVVSRRAEKTCVDGADGSIREFTNNDVIFLEDLRCDGAAHAGCGRSCSLFWKTAWVRSITATDVKSTPGAVADLARLKTVKGEGQYICQSSELIAATQPLTTRGRLQKCLREVCVGDRSAELMVWLMVSAAWRKFWQRYSIGVVLVGNQTRTPTEALNLQPGELVEVKSPEEIRATLDASGRNRGMTFGTCMTPFCGRQYRVKSRLDHMILEMTGQMRELSNTVVLEDVTCRCPMVVGGCPRKDSLYWREIWLKRVESPAAHRKK
ncbi:MAG: hypothetical protein WCS70_02590 [Verrucomicrobiota bacterium]